LFYAIHGKVNVKTASTLDETVALTNAGGIDLVTAFEDASWRKMAVFSLQNYKCS
jgi:hypothetical protein